MIKTICVCGAGTMGCGIAQVCAQSGFDTILLDLNESVLEKAKQSIQTNLQLLTSKGKISVKEKEQILRRIQFEKNIHHCSANFVLEAIIEKIETKAQLFIQLSEINNSNVIFASNTSSLSISQIQKNISFPERVVGMHFFNPAPIMQLVEVVKGDYTSEETIQTTSFLCKQLGKTPVVCKDAPGFIVNRVARHYYLEAMKLVEEGITSVENVDAIMEVTGFKMGPFKLIDLIGMDINLAVSQSIYEAFDKKERFKPSSIQIEKVRNGELGKKTGIGFYKYN